MWLIFDDGFITNGFLKQLIIEDSCILHEDYYHVLNEIWTKPENFRHTIHSILKDNLKLMISSKTLVERQLGYDTQRYVTSQYTEIHIK